PYRGSLEHYILWLPGLLVQILVAWCGSGKWVKYKFARTASSRREPVPTTVKPSLSHSPMAFEASNVASVIGCLTRFHKIPMPSVSENLPSRIDLARDRAEELRETAEKAADRHRVFASQAATAITSSRR